jgi:hypothetical protein
MLDNTGTCECGKVEITMSLPDVLASYTPRQCDCEFCTSRGICFLSHPDGKLRIQTVRPLDIAKQGSNQASFLTCSYCKTVIAASIQLSNNVIGALNAKLLSNFYLLQKPVVVSLKNLEAKEKISRWQSNWCNIKINGESRI